MTQIRYNIRSVLTKYVNVTMDEGRRNALKGIGSLLVLPLLSACKITPQIIPPDEQPTTPTTPPTSPTSTPIATPVPSEQISITSESLAEASQELKIHCLDHPVSSEEELNSILSDPLKNRDSDNSFRNYMLYVSKEAWDTWQSDPYSVLGEYTSQFQDSENPQNTLINFLLFQQQEMMNILERSGVPIRSIQPIQLTDIVICTEEFMHQTDNPDKIRICTYFSKFNHTYGTFPITKDWKPWAEISMYPEFSMDYFPKPIFYQYLHELMHYLFYIGTHFIDYSELNLWEVNKRLRLYDQDNSRIVFTQHNCVCAIQRPLHNGLVEFIPPSGNCKVAQDQWTINPDLVNAFNVLLNRTKVPDCTSDWGWRTQVVNIFSEESVDIPENIDITVPCNVQITFYMPSSVAVDNDRQIVFDYDASHTIEVPAEKNNGKFPIDRKLVILPEGTTASRPRDSIDPLCIHSYRTYILKLGEGVDAYYILITPWGIPLATWNAQTQNGIAPGKVRPQEINIIPPQPVPTPTPTPTKTPIPTNTPIPTQTPVPIPDTFNEGWTPGSGQFGDYDKPIAVTDDYKDMPNLFLRYTEDGHYKLSVPATCSVTDSSCKFLGVLINDKYFIPKFQYDGSSYIATFSAESLPELPDRTNLKIYYVMVVNGKIHVVYHEETVN
ncbi:hypothetical protein JW962_01100 [Candidatus Dojkabacteria bacterium]|nr:hypothetical protein [Candidatus Dojkabacteria bacterium]